MSARAESDVHRPARGETEGPDPAGARPGPARPWWGLSNTRARLVAMFGPQAGLELHPREQGGFVARRLIPRSTATLRISRAVIVNLDRINAIRSGLPGEWQVVLQDGRELLMTRGWKEVQARLQYSAPP